MTKRASAIAVALAAALFGTAVPASAQLSQQQQPRPNRGLFGGGVGDTSQQLTLGGSLGAGYYGDVRTTLTPGSTPRAPRSGQFGVGSANLDYSINLSRVSASLAAGTAVRYYPKVADPFQPSYFVGGQISLALGSRTSLSTAHHAALQPYTVGFFSGELLGGQPILDVPVDPNAIAATGTYQSWRSSVNLGHNLTQRLSLSGGYDYYTNNVWSGGSGGRYASQSARGGVHFGLAKGLSLRAGYAVTGVGSGAVGGTSPFRGRTIDAGIDFNRALSLTRKSTLAFSTGLVGLSDQGNKVRYHLTGHVSFGHEIGRSWTFSTGYNRSADFFQTFGQPVFRDALNAGIGGVIGRRVSVHAGVSIAKGTVGVSAGAPDYTAGSAYSGLQFAITRLLAIGVNYGFYHYEFDDAALLPPGLSSKMDRQSVRVSLNLWVPLMTRARRN